MIDIHVLTHEGTRLDWLQQALDSLEGQGATVHLVENNGQSVGVGRSRGYALGCHPFVSYLDSDDYLLPGAVAACLAALEQHQSVVSMEVVEYPDGSRYPFPRPGHALTVYRRADVLPLLPPLAGCPHLADEMLRQALRPHQISHLGYVWRVHPGGDHHKLTAQVAEQEAAAWRTQMEQQ